MQGLGRWALLAGLAACCGCALLRPRPADPGLFLLRPADAGFNATLTQSIQVQKGGTSLQAMAVVEISPDSVKLVALSPLGNRMLSLVWDGKKLSQERDPSLPKDFPAELILRDLQLALWSEASLRQALPAHWELKLEPRLRRFFRDGAEVITIRYSGDPLKDPIEFEHKALGYKLSIREVDAGND